MHLLIVDDDPKFRTYVRRGLEESDIRCTTASDGAEALATLREAKPGSFDLVLLDVMMPHQTGWELLEVLRAEGNDIPVVFVTARDGVEERVRGLEMGADDYIIKPFAFTELLARVDAVIRRRRSVAPLLVGDLCLDLTTRHARFGSEAIDLSPREFDLLQFLAENHGQVVSKSEILREVWGIDFDPQTNVIEVHIGRLRKRLAPHGEELILTLRGKGYLLDLEGKA